MKSVEWVVKASKFCNLRCAYCYEWNSLGDQARVSLDEWESLLDAIRCYHQRLEQRLGQPVEVRLIWHGGEPLALPATYLDAAMSLQRSVLAGLRQATLMQTNLYRVPDATLDVLLRHQVKLGVSMDVFSGVRLDARPETEAAVVANMDRLDRRGIRYGAITVLAQHNHRRMADVHDFWARRRIGFGVLPLFDGPPERPSGRFEASRTRSLSRRSMACSSTGSRPAQSSTLFRCRSGSGTCFGSWSVRAGPVLDRRRKASACFWSRPTAVFSD